MKFVADEGVDSQIVEKLRKERHDVYYEDSKNYMMFITKRFLQFFKRLKMNLENYWESRNKIAEFIVVS